MFKLTMFLGLLALASPALSAVNPAASLANPLGNSGASARAVAMGSAFVAVADDTAALFWNPAGLSGLRHVEVALHHNSWLASILQETAVVGLPLGWLGGVAVSLNYVHYGQFEGYDDNGARISDYSANRYGLGAGWGMEVLPTLSAGIAVKGSMQTIADTRYSDLSMDLGALWAPIKEVRLGLAYTNLGTAVAGFSPASALRAGASFRLDLAPVNSLLLSASATLEPGGVNRLQMGVEDLLYSVLALRLGYQASLADNQLDGAAGMSAGLGIMHRGLSLDYAYLPFGDLGAAQRLSLAYKFGHEAKAKAH